MLLTTGYWRILDFEYECRALSFLLNLIDEQSWSYNTIPMDDILNILGELLPPVILQHIIDEYSTWCVSSNLSKCNNFYYLKLFLYYSIYNMTCQIVTNILNYKIFLFYKTTIN